MPEVNELAWILSTVCPVGLLERCHSYKDKIAKGFSPSNALFTYPVLMAADILMYDSDLVPVGKDQKQHLEVTRDLAGKMNEQFGEGTCKLPDALIAESTAIVPGLDGQKMSKSYHNTLPIFGEEKATRKLIMRIPTDSTPVEEPKPTENSIILQLYKLFSSAEGYEDMVRGFRNGGCGYGDFKNASLTPIGNIFVPHGNAGWSWKPARTMCTRCWKTAQERRGKRHPWCWTGFAGPWAWAEPRLKRPGSRDSTRFLVAWKARNVIQKYMKNILVAIDFSNATDAVIHQIGKLACPNDSIIHLLHIVEPSICYEVSGVLPDEVPVPVMDQTEENEVISIAKNHLKKTAEKLSQLTDATIVQAVEDEFEISEAVINYAEKHHIDMIVVGKHNHGFLSTVFLGSVASSVMRKSPVPVLVVPVTKEEQ